MRSKAPAQENLRPHWGEVVINNGCLWAFFFFFKLPASLHLRKWVAVEGRWCIMSTLSRENGFWKCLYKWNEYSRVVEWYLWLKEKENSETPPIYLEALLPTEQDGASKNRKTNNTPPPAPSYLLLNSFCSENHIVHCPPAQDKGSKWSQHVLGRVWCV